MSARKKAIREKFRNEVFARDGHRCVFCDRTDHLDAHHIIDRNEMPNGGYVKENGITLCPMHHEQAEVWHSSGKSEHVHGMHPLDLLRKIGSNMAEANRKALLLGGPAAIERLRNEHGA